MHHVNAQALALGLVVSLWPQVGKAQEKSIPWEKGPCVGKLGSVAEIQVPKGFAFTNGEGLKTFCDLTHNIWSEGDLGVLMAIPEKQGDEAWFVSFSFDSLGYVKDDERDTLDANAILESIRKGTEKTNEIRKTKGWPTMQVIGWQQPPFYDVATNNLTWSILGHSQNEEGNVLNRSVRLLGRSGVMKLDMVASPESAVANLPRFNNIVKGFHYTTGNAYAEFKSGDKVATIGLTALVAGGAGAILVKSGLLAKFWKLIVVAFVAVASALKKGWNRLFGKERPSTMV